MITKLRRRMTATIMIFVSIIVLAAFISLYFVTYFRIYSENKEKLSSHQMVTVTSENQLIMDGRQLQETFVVNRISPAIGVYFNLIISTNGYLYYVDSALAMEQADYETAAAAAIKNPDGGITEIGGRKWQYEIFSGTYQIDREVEQPLSTDQLIFIRFLDITDSYKTLETLLLTLGGLYVILMALFFLLARFFAARSIRPVMEAWEMQQQFIADASHELKTPISTLNANLDVLYNSQDETIGDQVKWLDNSKKVLVRMTALVQSMLDLAKVDHTAETYDVERIWINQFLDETVDYYLPLADRKHITIKTDYDSDICTVSNYSMLQQVLELLLDNAVKYSDEGGTIEVAAVLEKKYTLITIRNTGPGISPGDIDKVFDRFFRGDRARVYQEDSSYGLGLAIAKSTIQRLKGNIRVKSDSAWTIFTVRIPNNQINK